MGVGHAEITPRVLIRRVEMNFLVNSKCWIKKKTLINIKFSLLALMMLFLRCA